MIKTGAALSAFAAIIAGSFSMTLSASDRVRDGTLDVRILGKEAEVLDGKAVSVKAYVGGVDGLWFACPGKGFAGADDCSGIDVVDSPDRRFLSGVIAEGGSCGVVTGRFVAFANGVIGLGGFRSEIGYVEATDFRKIPCDDL